MPSNPEGVGPPSGAPEFFIIGSPDEPAKESDAEGDEYLFEAFHDPHALPSDVPAEAPLPAMPLVVPSVNESLDATRCQGLSDCQQGNTCLTHHLWCELSHEIHGFLDGISLGELVKRQEVRQIAARQRQTFDANTIATSPP